MSDNDFMAPLDITMFGGEDDPCFGKLHLPTAKECKRCGDNEVCAIVMAQRAHGKRAKEEAKMVVHSKEEKNMDIVSIHKFVMKVLALNGSLRYKVLLDKVIGYFKQYEEVDKNEAEAMLKGYLTRSDQYIKYMKNGKRHVKIKK